MGRYGGITYRAQSKLLVQLLKTACAAIAAHQGSINFR